MEKEKTLLGGEREKYRPGTTTAGGGKEKREKGKEKRENPAGVRRVRLSDALPSTDRPAVPRRIRVLRRSDPCRRRKGCRRLSPFGQVCGSMTWANLFVVRPCPFCRRSGILRKM